MADILLFSPKNRSSWSGFMQTYAKVKHPGKTCVAMLPIINLDPSDEIASTPP